MKPLDLITLISDRFNAGIRRPIHIEGSPGIGKTQIVAQVAKTISVGFKVIHAPLLQAEDYGFPVISADRKDVSFIVSREKFPVEGSNCPETGIFLIDEMPQASNEIQKILRNLIQEREIHGIRLKAGWVIVTTGNRTADRAGSNRILSHLSNVLTRVELEVSLNDWTQWALDNNVKPEVIAFIRFKPSLLSAFDANAEINATPRAWVEGVSASLGLVKPHLEFETFKGDVGEGPAIEFTSHLKLWRELPNPDVILASPKTAEIPEKAQVLYALVGAMGARTTENNFSRVMEYISRMPSEFATLFVRDALRKCPAITKTKDFILWASGPGAKLLS